MTKTLQILLVIFSTSLYADCSSYTLLGSNRSFDTNIKIKNTIVWDYTNKHNWSASQPLSKVSPKRYPCEKSGYLLVNDDKISYKTPSYSKSYYDLKKGWNYLPSHKKGVDVVKTFSQYHAVKFVYVYDDVTKVWAGYSSDQEIQKNIYNTRILLLKTLEPGRGFFVYATKDIRVNIVTNTFNSTCQKLAEDKRFGYLVDSGLDSEMVYNKEKTLGFKSRYLSHYKKGFYDDSRVMLIYPKMKSKSKRTFKYGPVIPKTKMEFSKEYEGVVFFMYDYKQQKCYQGVFPSIKIPPFATLKELK